MPRYVVFAPTTTQRTLGSALTPGLTRTMAGWSSRGQIVGQPGTMAIAAPSPSAIRSDLTAVASGGRFYSYNSPDLWFPPIYYEANNPKEHAPVSILSDNQMPVPAKRAPNIIPAAPYRARLGGQRQVYQPQVVQFWPPMRGSRNA